MDARERISRERKKGTGVGGIEKLDSSASMEEEKNELTMSPYRGGAAMRRRGANDLIRLQETSLFSRRCEMRVHFSRIPAR